MLWSVKMACICTFRVLKKSVSGVRYYVWFSCLSTVNLLQAENGAKCGKSQPVLIYIIYC